MRKRNGDLHYYINGLDQGVAVSSLPARVWGVVDMYGRTVKVTIVDRDVNEEKNLLTRLSNSLTLSTENHQRMLPRNVCLLATLTRYACVYCCRFSCRR